MSKGGRYRMDSSMGFVGGALSFKVDGTRIVGGG